MLACLYYYAIQTSWSCYKSLITYFKVFSIRRQLQNRSKFSSVLTTNAATVLLPGFFLSLRSSPKLRHPVLLLYLYLFAYFFDVDHF